MKKVAGIAGILTAGLILTACGSGPSGTSGDPTPAPSGGGLTAGDAAALVSAGTVIQQIPQEDLTERQAFVQKLAKAKKTGKGVDLGVPDVTLSEYKVSSTELGAPSCIQIKPAKDGGAVNPSMAVLFRPPSEGQPIGAVIAGQQIATCEEAEKALDAINEDKTLNPNVVNSASMSFLLEAYSVVPFSSLSSESLKFFDQVRLFLAQSNTNLNEQSSSPPAPPATPATQPEATDPGANPSNVEQPKPTNE